jgi:hypothetical protein
MLWRPRRNAPTTTRGEFEQCRASVIWVIAPAPGRHAPSNDRRAGLINGRTTPQYECFCDGRTNVIHMRKSEEVLGAHDDVGETHGIAYVELPPICAQPINARARCFRSQCSNKHILLKIGRNVFQQVSLDASVQCTSNAPTLELKPPQTEFPQCSSIVEPQCQATPVPSNSAHLMRPFVWGLSIFVYHFYS